MTILGKHKKQPREVEIYAIQFGEDMAPTDEIVAGYAAITYNGVVTPELVKSGAYTATAADTGSLIYADASITVPASPSDGYTLAVCNTNQSASINVAGFTVAARCAILVRRTAGTWTAELTVTTLIVTAGNDQRIRAVVARGLVGTTYKVQLTALTAEGRTLEDEFTVRVKED